jgi:uncharacterized protein YjbI with pentapeptide repeats
MEIRNTTHVLAVENANLEASTFTDVNLANTVFENVRLEGATFTDICMGSVTIRDGSLRRLTIEECDIEGMRINGVLVSDLLEAYAKKS